MKPYYFIALLFYFSSCHPLCLDGLVLNEQDHPVVGAIIHKNTSREWANAGTWISDQNGTFCMETFRLGDTLYVQAAGYEPDTLIITFYPRKRLAIVLSGKPGSVRP